MVEPKEGRRFDDWNLLVPKVGQEIQLDLDDFRVNTVVTHQITKNGKTFMIAVEDPFSSMKILLEITPSATGKSRIDAPDVIGKKPYWQTVPQLLGSGERTPAQIFFLNEFPWKKYMNQGSFGAAVKVLKFHLKGTEFDPKNEINPDNEDYLIDGILAGAIKKLQKKHGLDPDGHFGPDSRGAFRKELGFNIENKKLFAETHWVFPEE